MSVESTQECADACLAREDCTSVLDYSWVGIDDLVCSLHIGSCDKPDPNEVALSDASREYVKVCGDEAPDSAIAEFAGLDGTVVDAESGCTFRVLKYETACAANDSPSPERAESLDRCFELCQEQAECGAVSYAYDIDTIEDFACELYMADCEQTVEATEPRYYFRKECE